MSETVIVTVQSPFHGFNHEKGTDFEFDFSKDY